MLWRSQPNILGSGSGRVLNAEAVDMLVATGLTITVFATASVAAGNARLEYDRDVWPILSENCFPCHGQDSKKRMAGLRLTHSRARRQTVTNTRPHARQGGVERRESADHCGQPGPKNAATELNHQLHRRRSRSCGVGSGRGQRTRSTGHLFLQGGRSCRLSHSAHG